MPRRHASAPSSLRRRWTVVDARSALAELAASGLSVAAFARREGIVAERLYRWHRQLTAERREPTRSTTPALIEIQPRATSPVEIVLLSGRVLRVSERIDADALARLVGALERSC